MAFPRIVLAVPLVIAGATLPGLTNKEPLPRRPNLVGMERLTFDRDAISIRAGQEIQFVNNSNFLHVLAPGDKARIDEQDGVPSFGKDNVRSMPRGEPFSPGRWTTPGTYLLTCTLHPEMNMTVRVGG